MLNTIPEASSKTRLSLEKLKTKLGVHPAEKLYGRETEASILLEKSKIVLKERRQALILVSGDIGCGKTSLATSLRSHVGFFVTGKFEQEQAFVDPYEVFIEVLTAYTREFLERPNNELLQRTRQSLMKEMGPEAKIILDMVPALGRLVDEVTKKPTKVYGMAAQYRIRYLFCQCFRVLTLAAPLVLVLDDLQWAGTASCELIRLLMNADDMPLLIIGTHRSYESVPPESGNEKQKRVQMMACSARAGLKPFETIVFTLRQEIGSRIEEICLGNLNSEAVTGMLSELLSRPEEETRSLANVVFAHTRGNAFHVLQFTRLLLSQGVIYEDKKDNCWKWDNAAIAARASPDSVMNFLRESLLQLPRLVQEVLKIASCMGNEIDESALDLILQAPSGTHLQIAAKEGLLLFYSEYGGYRFAHDWIRLASLDLVPEDEKKGLYLRIGRRLWKASKPDIVDKNIAMVVSLLNKGMVITKDDRECCRVAELNLRAAEKAVVAVSFVHASSFYRKGIRLLGSHCWKDPYYEITLALYTGVAETETVNGNYESVVHYIEEITAKARCIEHKLRAYAAFLTAMSQHDNLLETVKVGASILRQVGQRLPEKPTGLALSAELAKTKLALRGRSNDDILSLPLLDDPVKITTQHILSLIFFAAHRAFSLLSVITACRAIRITLKEGLHESSSLAFVNYAMVLSGFNEVDAGHRYGALAVSIAEKLQSRRHLPQVQTVVALSIFHWKGNLKSTFENLFYASQTALELGDIDVATLALVSKAVASIFIGVPFSDVNRELRRCFQMVRLHNMNSTANLYFIFQQLCDCYTGKATNPARLNGQSLNYEDMLKECRQTSNRYWMSALHFCSADLAYAFGEYELAHRMLEKNNAPRNHPKAVFLVKDIFYRRGLIAVQMYRLGVDKRQNKKRAQLKLKLMQQWASGAQKSWQHRVYLLSAELASLVDREPTPKLAQQVDGSISSQYTKAIELSERDKFWNDAALAAERYADYQLVCGDKTNALECYQRAASYYSAWGAIAKVDQLQRKMRQLTT